MAWTPDGKEVVFWAGGKIRRADVETREVREIPFHVASSRTVIDAVRFPVDVAPDTFTVKMIRWAQVSPDGGQPAVPGPGQAVARGPPGWQAPARDLAGRPLRVLPVLVARRPRDRLRHLGRPGAGGDPGGLRRRRRAEPQAHPRPGPLRRAGLHPGRRARWSTARPTAASSPARSGRRRPAIYRVATRGAGAPEMVVDHGREPHFGAASDRVFLTGRDGDKTSLFSVAARRARAG